MLPMSEFHKAEMSATFRWGARGSSDDQQKLELRGHIVFGTQHSVNRRNREKDDYHWHIHTHPVNTRGSAYMPPSENDMLIVMDKAANDPKNRGGLSIVIEPKGAWFTCATDSLSERLRSEVVDINEFRKKYKSKFYSVSSGREPPKLLCSYLQSYGFISDFIPRTRRIPSITSQLFQ
jgi:hypothetical protein